jgi:hypothetical protein
VVIVVGVGVGVASRAAVPNFSVWRFLRSSVGSLGSGGDTVGMILSNGWKKEAV